MRRWGELAQQIADPLGLTPCEAAIVGRLYGVPGWVEAQHLCETTAPASRIYDHAAVGRSLKALHVHIHNIRWKLGMHAILCMPDRGYTLGAPAIMAVKKALQQTNGVAA